VPSTWQPQPTIERFRSICEKAGFSQYSTHSIAIGLTEAEAIVVYTSGEAPGLFKAQEVILVCDMGTGITDLSTLKVKGIRNRIELVQMDVVSARTIGSAKIDEAFQNLAYQRLLAAKDVIPLEANPCDIAWRMMMSREFQNAKADFGSPDDPAVFTVPTFGLDRSYTNRSFDIHDGVMIFAHSDMQSLFDTQIAGLYQLLDNQIIRFKSAHPHENISHLILSGDLANSAYVQNRLRQKYSTHPWSGNSQSLMVHQPIACHVAPDPQLAVCKGLVADRISILSIGTRVRP
jgi:hypothetical protein